jgi:hypothetical protein
MDVSSALSWSQMPGEEEPISVRFTHDFGSFKGEGGRDGLRTILLQMSSKEAMALGTSLIEAALAVD